jgi:hypothetical protein
MTTYVRQKCRNRITKSTIFIFDTKAAENEFDPQGGRWVTFCDEHKTLCNHGSLRLAKSHAAVPDWCEACQEIRLRGHRGA